MLKEKEFDCVKFKDTLFSEAWKKSGAKNYREYVEYVNARARKSGLFKKRREPSVGAVASATRIAIGASLSEA